MDIRNGSIGPHTGLDQDSEQAVTIAGANGEPVGADPGYIDPGYMEARRGNRLVAVALEQDLLPSQDRSADAIDVTARVNLMAAGDLVEGRRPHQVSRPIRVAVVPHPGDYLALSGADTVVFVEVTDVAGASGDPSGIVVSAGAPRRDTGPILAASGWEPSRSSYPEKAVARKLLVDSARTGDIAIITISD